MQAFQKIGIDGGINLLDDPRRIADGELVRAQNLVPVRPGILKMRPACTLQNVVAPLSSAVLAAGTEPSNATLRGMWPVEFGSWPADFLYAIEHSPDAGLADDARLQLGWGIIGIEGTLTDFHSIGTPGMHKPQCISYIDNMYVFTGMASGYKLTSDGATITKTALNFGTGNDALKPYVAALYRDHFVYGNLAAGYENAILISAISDPETVGDNALAANGRYIYVGSSDERIVAMCEIALTAVGSPVDTALLILKERSAYVLTGLPSEPGVALDLQDLTLSRIAFDCGCAAAETLVRTPNGVIWASADDVWSFAIGQTPQRIGTKIRPALQETIGSHVQAWHAVYANGFYRLAVTSESETGPCLDQYWLDLRDGLPGGAREAKWWGPMQYKMAAPWYANAQEGTHVMMSTAEGLQYSLILEGMNTDSFDGYFGQHVILVGFEAANNRDCIPNYPIADAWAQSTVYASGDYVHANGQLFRCSIGGTSEAAGDGPVYASGASVTDNTVTWAFEGSPYWAVAGDRDTVDTYIECELRTKSYDFGDSMVRKLFQGAELNLFTTDYGQCEWDILADEGYTRSEDNDDNTLAYGFVAGVGETDEAASRPFQSIALHAPSDVRINGNTLQFVLRNKPGYLVVEGYNDVLAFGYDPDGGSSGFAEQLLTPGYYTDLYDFLDMLKDVIDDAFAAYPVDTIFTSTYAGRTLTWDNDLDGNGVIGISSEYGWGQTSQEILTRAGQLIGLTGNTRMWSGLINAERNYMVGAPVPFKRSGVWEIGEIRLKIKPVNRRPA
jgi:hypothetical protein